MSGRLAFFTSVGYHSRTSQLIRSLSSGLFSPSVWNRREWKCLIRLLTKKLKWCRLLNKYETLSLKSHTVLDLLLCCANWLKCLNSFVNWHKRCTMNDPAQQQLEIPNSKSMTMFSGVVMSRGVGCTRATYGAVIFCALKWPDWSVSHWVQCKSVLS